jgi:hypothetical protein
MMMSKIEFQVENARLLEKLPNVDSYNGWKSRGKQVKKGAKQRAYRVQAGTIQRFDPITGEGYSEPRYVTAYGFGADQVY